MQTLYVLTMTIVLVAGTAAASVSSADITGAWSRTDGGSRISVEPCGDRICAVNTWVKDSASESVGDRLVMTLQPSDDARLSGEAVDEKRGVKYSMVISVERDAMTTQGCMLSGIVCKTRSWTRLR